MDGGKYGFITGRGGVLFAIGNKIRSDLFIAILLKKKQTVSHPF
jgi:hypothetical protein